MKLNKKKPYKCFKTVSVYGSGNTKDTAIYIYRTLDQPPPALPKIYAWYSGPSTRAPNGHWFRSMRERTRMTHDFIAITAEEAKAIFPKIKV